MPILRNRWLMLAVLFLARTTMALQFQTVASTGLFLIDALAIDFASLGLLIGLYMLPGVVIALPGGMLGQRFGAKRVVLVGLALMTIGGVLMGLSTSFASAAVGRLISGIGAVLLTVLIAKMVADWFAGGEVVVAMSIVIVSWSLGIGAALIVFGPVAQTQGWSTIMYVGAVGAIMAFVLVALIYRDPPGNAAGPTASLRLELTRREWVLVLIAGAVWGFFNVAYIVIVSFVPELFVARGYSLSEASLIVSMIGWGLIPAIPLVGLLVSRVGGPHLFMLTGCAVGTAAAAILPFVTAPLAAFAVLGLAVAVPAGLIMALPAQVLRPQTRASGMGVFFTCYYLAMATLPGVAGLMRDLSGSAAAPALFAGAMMLLCLIGLMLFHACKRMREN